MNSALKIMAGNPGEAWIILENEANRQGEALTVAFPQFPSFPVQSVLRQEIQGNDLLLVIDGDDLGDILEGGSPCQIKIPELELTENVIWPMIIGKRSLNRKITAKSPEQSVENPVSPIAAAIAKGSLATIVPAASSEPSKDNNLAISDHENADPFANENPVRDNASFTQAINQQENSQMAVSTTESPAQTESSAKKGFSALLGWLRLGILILTLGLLIRHWLDRGKPEPAAPPPATHQDKENQQDHSVAKDKDKETSQSSPPVSHGLQDMAVNDVIAQASNTAQLTKEGKRRLTTHQADDGILLLEAAASKGDKDAMLELGRLYSPVDFKTGGAIPNPDMREAARYFQKAAQNGAQEAIAPREALHQWLIQKAEGGDEMARLTLKDFW